MTTTRIALITGGSAGIGQATALELARQNVGVIVTYRSHAAEGAETVADIEAAGGKAAALRLDLNDTTSIPGFVGNVTTTLEEKWGTGRLDFLVNNAGVGGGALFSETTEEQFDMFHRVLVKGPYFLTQRLLPILRDGGAIVNTGSTSALPNRVSAGYSSYASQKAAIHALTPYWAKELAGRRIRVNAIAPGTTRTRIGDDAFLKSPELADSMGAAFALGRIGEPSDAADVIAFLLSDAARWVTGQVVEVAGGEGL
jgi:NAD(P)-dependent dehydrogenase (short-subunit alcohol dehydrogenase family)